MNIMNNYNLLSIFNINYVVIISLLMIVILISFLLLLRSKFRKISKQLAINKQVLDGMTPEQGVEKHLNQYLELIIPIIQARGYYFYLFEPKSNNYVLRVNRQESLSPGRVTPSYAGLLPYSRETYNPPLGLPMQNQDDVVAMIKEGEVPLVQVIIKGGDGLIRVGPVKGISGMIKASLETIGETLQPALSMVVALEKQKSDTELVVATGKAINGIAKSMYDVDSLSSKMMILSAKMIQADACCLIINQASELKVPFVSGLENKIETELRKDHYGLQNLYELVGTLEFCQFSTHTKDLDKVPSYLEASGFHSMLLLKVHGLTFEGVAVFWHYQVPAVEHNRIVTVRMLLTRLEELFEQQTKYKELSSSYLGALKILVEATDNLEPSTIGHSELIANYSVAIAKQLKLPEQDVQDIKLAAYFHDIGMIGLSNDILFKPGKYTALEFETMKLHAEVGASIGESTIANVNASKYIRHHHERWDGYGYPHGLRGEEIPLGARIIAVADMFNAKLGGRKYREPATFEQALKDLETSAGTQLDPISVRALLDWFRIKQADPSRRGKSLGPCWAMRCSQPSICKQCVAFNRTDKNCWEFEGVNCAAHGNKCTTCFIHTEALYRKGQKLDPFFATNDQDKV